MEARERKEMWLKRTAILTLGMVFVFAILVFFARPAQAINQQITFQGKLTNTSGYNVANGTFYVKLTIYNASTGGTCQYSATSSCASVTSTPVTVTNGIFSVNLGDTSASLAALPATLFNAPELYLGITVCSGPGTGCDSEMTPRKRITAVPYAFSADYLGGVTTSTAGGNGSYIPATDSSGNLRLSNSFYAATSTTGQVGVGTSTVPSGIKTFVESTTATDKLLVVRGNSSQSGNVLELQNSAGRPLSYFDYGGSLYVGGGGTTSTVASSTLLVGAGSGYSLGKFYVDSSGNASASGTLTVFGSQTASSTLLTSTGLTIGKGNNYQGGVFRVDSTGAISSSGSLFIGGGNGPTGSVTLPVHKNSYSSSTAFAGVNSRMVVAGNYLYIAADGSPDSLQIFDISTSTFTFKGALFDDEGGALLNGVTDISVVGSYAYIVSFTDSALEIIDVSNPVSSTHKSSLVNGTGGALLSNPRGLAVSGNYAYIAADGSNALEIVDISNPANPTHKGSLSDGGVGPPYLDLPLDIYVRGRFAYVLDYTNNALNVVDISNPAAPRYVSSITGLTEADNIDVSGNYAYIASAGQHKLYIVDISNPTSPALRSTLSNGGGGGAVLNSPRKIFAAGRYVYVPNWNGSFEIVDVSDPGNPRHSGLIMDGEGGAALMGAAAVAVSGNYAYVVTQFDGLEALDVSGALIPNAEIGNLLADDLQVFGPAYFDRDLFAQTGLSVAGSALLMGDVAIGGGLATTTVSSTLSIHSPTAIGAWSTGNAMLYITASSTTSKPLVIRANSTQSTNLTEWQTSGGSVIGYFATSSAGGTPNIAVLSVGSTSVGGFLILQGDASTGAGFQINNSAGATTVNFNTDGDLTLSNGTTVTSTYSPNSILLAKQTGFELGKFYVNSSGDVSASGTLGVGTGALTGTNAVGFGNNITVSGHRSFAFGNGSMATGSQAFAGGTNAWAGGNDSLAFGNQVAAFGSRSFAFGNNVTSSVSNSFAFGDNVKATQQRAFIFGRGDYTVDNAPLVNDTLESFMVGFGTSTYPALMVSGGGVTSVVGIATTSQMFAGSTRYRLLVDAQGTTNPGIGVNGYIKATGAITQSTSLDLAEKYPIDPACEARGDCPEAGDVVAAQDSEGGVQTFYVHKATFSDDEKIIGIISTQPGFLLEGGLVGLGTRNLTLAGRVPVKVSVENGAIHVGDKLAISSSTPGVVMKYTGSGTVVGMALENYTSVTPGKIVAYVSLGWDRPYTNSNNISVDPLTNPQNPNTLNTQSNGSQLVQQNLDMGGYSILNIKSIAGKDGKWEIDENGWLVNTLATTEGKKKVYGVASESAELNLSGSGQLVNGEAKVDLATSTREMLSAAAPIKVSVTLTAEARGVYVAEKGAWGFKVKELNSGASNATFDWVIIARRKTQSEIDEANGDNTNDAVASTNDTNMTSTTIVIPSLPAEEAGEAEESSSSTTLPSPFLTGGAEPARHASSSDAGGGDVVTTTESIATGSD